MYIKIDREYRLHVLCFDNVKKNSPFLTAERKYNARVLL